MRANRYKFGYTLVEALVAVVILSLIILVVYSSWFAVLDASENGTLAAKNAHQERMAMRAIEDALASPVWYESQSEETIKVRHTGRFSSLKTLSRVPPDFWGARELGAHPLRRIEFFTEKAPSGDVQLIMEQQALPNGTNSPQSHRTILLPRVKNFLVEIQEKKPNETTDGWVTSWHKTNALPSLVRVSLAESEQSPRQKTFPIIANLAIHAKPPRQTLRLTALQFERDGIPGAGSEDGAKVVFIIDKSVSMNMGRHNRLAIAKNAVRTSLNKMAQSGDRQFAIYTYNKESESFGPQLARATIQNVKKADEWLNTQNVDRRLWGNQGILESIQKVFDGGSRPTEIWLIADAGFLHDTKSKNPLNVRGALSALNTQKTPFNIILLEGVGQDLNALLSTPFGTEIERIHTENNGIFLPINL
tara:strand:+ start:1840 stop:3096 length:1257 start_codon:yes stop_codon:yes gene_type:complete